MNVERKVLPVMFKNYESLNDSTARVKVYVMYAGNNRNGSHFSREAIEDAMQSIYGLPVVGEYRESIDNFKGHGGKIIIDSDGVQFVETTKPYGFVPFKEDMANPRWETVKDEDGNSKDYFVVDAYLWKRRYPELNVVFEKGSNQSMEILVDDGDFADADYFNVTKYRYDALCILGKDEENIENNTEPCFEDAQIVAYSLNKDDFKMEFSEMINDIKESLKVGELLMKNREEYSIILEEKAIDENIKFDAHKEALDFNAKLDAHKEALDENSKFDAYKDAVMEDIKFNAHRDAIDENIKFDAHKEAMEENARFEASKEIIKYEELYNELKELHDALVLENEKLQENFNVAELELNEYKLVERLAEEKGVFSKYEKLLKDNLEFEELKLNAKDYSIEQLEDKLAIIYVRNSNLFSARQEKDKLIKTSFKSATNNDDNISPLYGDLFIKNNKK